MLKELDNSRKEEVDVNKMNFVKKLLSGSKSDEDVQDMQMILDSSVRLTKSEYMGLITLNQLNSYFGSELINDFGEEYLSLRKKTKHTINDLVKTVEVRSNKKLIEKTSIGMSV